MTTLSPAAPSPWAAAAPGTVRALDCPNCGGTVALRAAGASVTLVCEHCGSSLDTAGEVPQLIARAHAAMHRPPIPLGTRGTLDGVLWEAIGYAERSDGDVDWAEYLLFNPYEGYAFLVDDHRRFSLGRVMDRMPDRSWQGMEAGGHRYRQYGVPYRVTVRFVVGEFYWRVAVGEAVTATDYVTPGHMLSCEENGEERSWTALTMLDHGVAERAFGIDPRPRRTGGTPSPHEPSPWLRPMREALVLAGLALAVLLVVMATGPSRRRLVETRVEVPLDGGTRNFVAGPVTLPARARVAIDADASGLDNGWVDLDYALVDRRTQARYDAYTTAERYSGTDADGAWSEGDSRPGLALSSIPAGTYDLVIEGEAHRWGSGASATMPTGFAAMPAPDAVPVAVAVTAGGGFPGNAALALLLLAIWPVVALCLHAGWEARRMAPVGGGSDDGDDE